MDRKSTRPKRNLTPSIQHNSTLQEAPDFKMPRIGSPYWPQECARLLLICTYLQNPRLRPRPRLRTPRNIIHLYPKTTNPDLKCPASKEHHQLKTTPKDEILKNPSHFSDSPKDQKTSSTAGKHEQTKLG